MNYCTIKREKSIKLLITNLGVPRCGTIIMMELIKSITKSEWKFWAKVLVALLILTSLSRIFVFIMMPSGFAWRGNTIMNVNDRNVYVSYIEQAREGRYLFDDLYTSKEESVPMLNLFWLSLGLFARFTHLSANAVLEVSRILFIPFLLFAVYLLIAYFIKDIWQRKLAHLLACFGGGLGAVYLPFGYVLELVNRYNLSMRRHWPIDLDITEAFIYSTSYYSSHFIFSTILFIFIILLFLLAVDKQKLFYALPAGIMLFILANFHPFTFVILFFILFSYFIFLLWKNKKDAWFFIKYGLIAGAIALPSVLYHMFMFYTPWWQNQTWKTSTVTPFATSIIFGYGVVLFSASYSLWLSFRSKLMINKEWFLLVWIVTQPPLLFLPVAVQGRFLEGYWLVLAIVGSYFLGNFLRRRKWIIENRAIAGFLFISIFCLSYILLMILDLQKTYLGSNLIYVKKDMIAAMKELKNISGKDDLILADIYNASVLPAIALRHVFVGHGVETINYDKKYKILKKFMASTDEKERELVVKNNEITYLFYDELWTKDWAWSPDDEKFLQKIYDKSGYKIYKVK